MRKAVEENKKKGNVTPENSIMFFCIVYVCLCEVLKVFKMI
jgi:hypothetical protein